MSRLKGLRVRKLLDLTYEITPIFYARRGGQRVGKSVRDKALGVAELVSQVLHLARGRQDPSG